MPFSAPAFEAIRARYLRDLRSQIPDADVTSDSDNYVRGSSLAALAEGLYQAAGYNYRQIFPDTADSEELERHASTYGITRRGATAASGYVDVTGTSGQSIPVGTSCVHVSSGAALVTTDEAVIDNDGNASVPVRAVNTGVDANGLSGRVVFNDAPLGIDNAGTLNEPLAGGTDAESDADLLARLLDFIRNPPSGGTAQDFRRWALEVDGVSDAIVFAGRRGPGSVDVVITSGDGQASEETILAAQQHIHFVGPVAADVWVVTPAVSHVDVALRIDSEAEVASFQQRVEEALDVVFNDLGIGDTLRTSRIIGAVSQIEGIDDVVLIKPHGNVPASVNDDAIGWLRRGTVTLEPMS
ncbi:hypothetical protein R84981_001699 [Carnimonas sp. R-84981]|uniref:baseplate J/gp47 family protein n=1 Tax=Carnimonas bestiolae TaxID=3402172 RepID=UPI003EDB6F9D